jgi:hypothetical protein
MAMSVTEMGEKYNLPEEIKSEIRRTAIFCTVSGVFIGISIVLFELSVIL